MEWKEKYGFDEIRKITNATSKFTIEMDMINHFRKWLEEKGLLIKKTYKPEWDIKNKKVLIRISVGRCKNLAFIGNKAFCLIYENRPKGCRDYFCKKIHQKIMIEKIKVSEGPVSYQNRILEIMPQNKKIKWK